MRQRCFLLAVPLAVGLAITAVPGTASAGLDGSGVQVQVGGRQFNVGEVVAVGQLVDATCVFETPVGVTVTSLDGDSGAAQVSADSACNVVVSAITAVTDAAGPTDLTRRQVPKTSRAGLPGGLPALADASGQSVGVGGAGVSLDGSVPDGGLLPAFGDRTKTYTGFTRQRFLDATRTPQFEDAIAMDYTWNDSWGMYESLRVNYKASYCAVYNSPTTTAVVNDLSVDDCLFEHPQYSGRKGGDSAGMAGSGRFFRRAPYANLDPTVLREVYATYANQQSGSCTYTAIPVGWTADCAYWRDERAA